jgi:hypothetical protein
MNRVISYTKRDREGKFIKGHKRPKEWIEKHKLKMIGENNPFWNKKHSEETIKKIKEKRKLQDMSWRKGLSPSKESRKKNSLAHIGKNLGEKCNFWKGGLTKINILIRSCFRYRQWRSDVFTKDNFTCQDCYIRGGNLEAHHIKKFSIILAENNIKNIDSALKCEELWNINNGKTLCLICHRKTFNKK